MKLPAECESRRKLCEVVVTVGCRLSWQIWTWRRSSPSDSPTSSYNADHSVKLSSKYLHCAINVAFHLISRTGTTSPNILQGNLTFAKEKSKEHYLIIFIHNHLVTGIKHHFHIITRAVLNSLSVRSLWVTVSRVEFDDTMVPSITDSPSLSPLIMIHKYKYKCKYKCKCKCKCKYKRKCNATPYHSIRSYRT